MLPLKCNSDQVVGVVVLRTEWDKASLSRQYEAQLGDSPVRIHHMVMAPAFQVGIDMYILSQASFHSFLAAFLLGLMGPTL